MNHKRTRQCRCCMDIFTPDYRNAKKQVYCGKPECRQASKRASQKQWSANNPNYFSGSINVDRVRQWRIDNPDRATRKSIRAVLQDDCADIADLKQSVTPHLPPKPPSPLPVLQDYCITQHPVFVGLIAHFTGYTLQDDIDAVTRRLEQLGQDVICSTTGGRHESPLSHLPRPAPLHSRTVQLGGSPSGP